MTDDDLARRYEALRRAAAAVIEEAAAGEAPVSQAHRQNLDALGQALAGRGSQSAVTREVLDPDRHLLSMRDYDRAVPGGALFSLAGYARMMREGLAADEIAEQPIGYEPEDDVPALTELQAMIVATLLRELAARLAAARDPGGRDLAAVALELADEVLAPTFAGAQR
jgi:hypothetical protein